MTIRSLWADAFAYDARHALRRLARSVVPSIVIVGILGAAIGPNVIAYAFLDAAVIHLVAVEHPETVVRVYTRRVLAGGEVGGFAGLSYPEFSSARERVRGTVSLAAVVPLAVRVDADSTGHALRLALVSNDYFQVAGVRPEIGQTLIAHDDAELSPRAAIVLSDHYWREQFGGDRAAIGRHIAIRGVPYTIVGVAPTGFRGFNSLEGIDAWAPLSMDAAITGRSSFLDDRHTRALQVYGRLRMPAEAGVAAAKLKVVAAALSEIYPETNENITIGADLAQPPIFPNRLLGTRGLITLFGLSITLLVLLVACSAIAHLQLARASQDARSTAIRLALGAPTNRLVRQLLIESFALALAGAVLGYAASVWGIHALQAHQILDNVQFHFSGRLAFFGLLLAAGTTIASGLLPARRAASTDYAAVLKAGAASVGRAQMTQRRGFAAFQLAVAIVLTHLAVQLARNIEGINSIDAGFDTTHLLAVSVDLSGIAAGDGPRRTLTAALMRELATTRGVVSVGVAGQGILVDAPSIRSAVTFPDFDDGGKRPVVTVDVAGPSFFSTTGIPMISGREFALTDDAAAPARVIVNETLAKKYWPNLDPIGRRVSLSKRVTAEVIGVARDARTEDLHSAPQPTVTRAILQLEAPRETFYLRTLGDPGAFVPVVTKRLGALDGRYLANSRLETLNQLRSDLMSGYAAVTAFGAVFAGLALLLATIGLYSVTSFAIVLRVREIGIRIALGATGRDIIRLVIQDAARIAMIGSAVGIVLALVVSYLLRAAIFGISAPEGWGLAELAAILTGAVFAATLVPLRRALRISAAGAMRAE